MIVIDCTSWASLLRINLCAAGSTRPRARRTDTAWERTPWHATQRAAWEALG